MKREWRYEIAKRKDIVKYLTKEEHRILSKLLFKIDKGRLADNKSILTCIVVESDWPEYEQVWKMIEKRMDRK